MKKDVRNNSTFAILVAGLSIVTLLSGCILVKHDLDKTEGMEAEDHSRCLKVMTINAWYKDYYLDERLQLVADEILREKPDIVGMQEIRQGGSAGKNRAERIAELTGYNYTYHYAKRYERYKPDGEEEGLAILTRHKIIKTDYIPLTNYEEPDFLKDPWLQERICLRAEIAAPSGNVLFFDTHLCHDDDAERVDQARDVVDYVKTFNSTLPMFLVGDFNAEPKSEPIDILTKYFVDVWENYAGSAEGGYTFSSPMKDGKEPEKRIDYIFVAPTSEFKVIDCQVCFKNHLDFSGEQIYPSDHEGVMAIIEVEQ